MAIEFDLLTSPNLDSMDTLNASMSGNIPDPTLVSVASNSTTFDVINDLLVNVIVSNVKPNAPVINNDDDKDTDINQSNTKDDTISSTDDSAQSILSMLFSTAMLGPLSKVDPVKTIQSTYMPGDDVKINLKKELAEKTVQSTQFAQPVTTLDEQQVGKKEPTTVLALPDTSAMFKLDELNVPSFHHAMVSVSKVSDSKINQFDLPQSQNSDTINSLISKIGIMINQQTVPNYQFSVNDIQIIDTQTEITNNTPINKTPVEFNVEIPLHKEHMSNQIVDAYIKIYPPELGHVLAKIKINNLHNTADLQIQTQNLQVKQIVEQNLPALRNSFSQTPIQLANVQIEINPSIDNGNLQQDLNQNKNHFEDIQSEERLKLNFTKQNVETPLINKDSLVDTYA